MNAIIHEPFLLIDLLFLTFIYQLIMVLLLF